MQVMQVTELRKQIAKVIDAAIDGGEETIISRPGGKAAIIVALDEWNEMKETLFLLSSRANARHLLDSLDSVEKGDLIDYAQPELDQKSAQDAA